MAFLCLSLSFSRPSERTHWSFHLDVRSLVIVSTSPGNGVHGRVLGDGEVFRSLGMEREREERRGREILMSTRECEREGAREERAGWFSFPLCLSLIHSFCVLLLMQA